MRGMAHYHHPPWHCRPSLQNSQSARPSGPVALGVVVRSQMACVTVSAVPGVRATCASQHIRLYGIAMEGATW